MSGAPGEGPRSLLIVRTGAIGDVANALVVANAVRDGWPGCRVGWVVHPLSAPLVEGHPSVDRVHTWRRGTGIGGVRALVGELRREGYAVALDLQRLQKSALVARMSGAPRTLGFDRARSKELSWIWSRERIEPGPRREHMVRQYMRFPRALGLPAGAPRRSLPPSDEGAAFAEAFVARHGAPVLINLGASRPAKLWPVGSFRDLVKSLIARPIPGIEGPVALTGGPGDAAAARAVGEGLDVVDLTGHTSLPELWSLCARARAMVTADTGPMHLCAAVGTPVVALFGPGDPARTGPFGEGHRVLQGGRLLERAGGAVSLAEPWAPAPMEANSVDAVRHALGLLPQGDEDPDRTA